MRLCEKNSPHLLQVCFDFFQAQLQISDLTVQYFQRQTDGAPKLRAFGHIKTPVTGFMNKIILA
jgi:hypothetical protein